MTAHDHTERVPGCFRCDLSSDEVTPTPKRVVLTDDERESLAVAAFCAPDKEIMSSLEVWLAARDSARESALRAQIKADLLAAREAELFDYATTPKEVMREKGISNVEFERGFMRGLALTFRLAARIAGGDTLQRGRQNR